jgi:hypothetical protein
MASCQAPSVWPRDGGERLTLVNDYALFRDLEEVLHRHGLTVVSRDTRRLGQSLLKGKKDRRRITLEVEEP